MTMGKPVVVEALVAQVAETVELVACLAEELAEAGIEGAA